MVKAAFSAPGKALLVGGYLVLDPKYQAYSVALSARIHTLVDEKVDSTDDGSVEIICSSPQFTDSTWKYTVDKSGLVTSERNECENPFLRACVLVASAYTAGQNNSGKSITLTIYSDDAFHTQIDSVPKGTEPRKQFRFHDSSITKVPKTGLGSSAALTVSVMAALLSCLDSRTPFSTDSESAYYDVAHNLSQVAHCYAQGKIGSGFDIATAIWGSIVYQRFDPLLLNKVCDLASQIDNGKFTNDLYKEFVEELQELVSSLKVAHSRCALPAKLSLLMGDVNGGSETPKLVSQVLKWKNENPERAEELWGNLYEQNMMLVSQLEAGAPDYEAISKTIMNIRGYLRALSKEANVPIEPPSQAILLDKCQTVTGVVGGIVPGAGGYDAISLLVETDHIEQIKEQNRKGTVLKSVTWLDLHEESVGLQAEKPEGYPLP